MAGPQLLQAKKETTPGTAPTMAAVDAIWAENVSFKPSGTRVTLNPAKPGSGANPGVVTGEFGDLTFDTLLVGSGTPGVAPPSALFFKSSGWAEDIEEDESVAYTRLAEPNTDTLAFKWSDEGRLHVLVFARGKGDPKTVPGQPGRLSWTYRGILIPVTGRSPVLPADADFDLWPTAEPIDHDNTTFVFDGVEMTLLDLSLTAADNVKYVDKPGLKGTFLKGDRSFTGSVKAHMKPVADFNPEAKWLDQSREEFSLTYGTEPGSIVTITGVAQLDGVTYSKEEEFDSFSSNLVLVGSSDAASDDITIVFT